MSSTAAWLARRLALTSAAAFVAVTVAPTTPTAAAEPVYPPLLAGTYTYSQNTIDNGVEDGEWVISPICASSGCTLIVTESAELGGRARLVSGQWSFSFEDRAAGRCSDGSPTSALNVWSFDASTADVVAGTLTVTRQTLKNNGATCTEQPAFERAPFSLTFVEPLQNLTDLTPLICNDPNGRLCA